MPLLPFQAKNENAEHTEMVSPVQWILLANAMPQLVWIAEPDGTVTYYNDRVYEYSGARKNNNAWEWDLLLHPEDRHMTEQAWIHSVRTGSVYEIEHRVQMADGSYRWHLSRGYPQVDAGGKIIKWFGTATDIHN
jgi:PAS domain S-box-containing protein